MIDTFSYSPNIPAGLIKPRESHRRSKTHLVNFVDIRPQVFVPHIPQVFKDRLCFTMRKEGHGGEFSEKVTPCCGGCGNHYFWLCHVCAGCGSFFIRDFYHPAWCSYYPCCWSCLPRLPRSFCSDHHNLIPPKHTEPYGINPKLSFTDEELQALNVPVFKL